MKKTLGIIVLLVASSFVVFGQQAQTDPENLAAIGRIGQIHHDPAVETPGTHQCRVEHIRPVCGGHDDDILVFLETIEF